MMRKRILLVDDGETTLEMERRMLTKEYDLVMARDGEEAYERAVDEKPDLVVLDLILPKMDGFEVCKKLRNTEATKGIPIIMISGRSRTMEEAIETGFDDYMMKPVNHLELLRKVKNCLEAHGAVTVS